mgnify:FL=1
MDSAPSILLASASPRRAELLRQIGVHFETLPVNIDESPRAGEPALDFVQRLALEKAQSGYLQSGNGRPVLGSDTIVVVDEHILGKPTGREDALRMLELLSGRGHQVMTAVALVDGQKAASALNVSQVYFRSLQPSEIEVYWDTGEAVDKAGAYGIQGMAAQFIERLDGSYSGVMGLPLFETAQLLQQFGIVTLA